jgi:tRNA G18 (ribose-2'-O)-methylase SpoU
LGQNVGRRILTLVLLPSGTNVRRALTTSELRRTKIARDEFLTQPRRPITVVLDGVTQNYNIGAIFRLCDAFLVQQLVIWAVSVRTYLTLRFSADVFPRFSWISNSTR